MRKITIILLITLICSCKSASFFKPIDKPDLLGVVYDRDNNPIQNGYISFESEDMGRIESFTDINGQFLVEDLKTDLYSVNFQASGVIPIELEYNHTSPNNILIIRVESIESICRDLKDSLIKNRLEISKALIEKLNQLEINDPYTLFLNSIYLFKLGKYKEAKFVLNKTSNFESKYIKILMNSIEEKLHD